MAGQTDWTTRSFSFTEPQTYHLIVIATDTANRTTRDTLTIEPQDPPEAVGGDTGTSNGTTTPPNTSNTRPDGGATNHECEEAAVVRAAGAGPPAVVTCVDGKDPDFVGKWAEEKCSANITDCKYVDPDGQDADRGSVSNNRVGNPGTGWDSTSRWDRQDAGRAEVFESGPSRSKVSAGGNSRGGYVI
jgi:hypothetical protein